MRMPLSSPLSFAIVPFNGSLSTAREPRSIVKSFEHETNVFVTSKYHLEEMGRSGGKGAGARKRERLEDKVVIVHEEQNYISLRQCGNKSFLE